MSSPLLFENLVGPLHIENVDCTQNCMKYINKLACVNMRLWPQIGGMKGKHMTTLTVTIKTDNGATLTAQKDCMNNIIINGFEFVLFQPRSVHIVYRIPVKNTWNVQDLVASEIFNHPYKIKDVVERKTFTQVTLEGVL